MRKKIALIPLDFCFERSVRGRPDNTETNMDEAASIIAMKLLQEIRSNIETAAGIAKAADLCATQGSVEQAIRLVMASEDPAFQAKQAFNALLEIAKLSKLEYD